MAKVIELTRGYCTVVDDCDYERVLAAGPWYAGVQPNGNVYANHTITKPDGKRTTLLLHRFILDAPEGMAVDHIACGETLLNTRNNLRLATRAQNSSNRYKHKNTSSMYKGVCWDREAHKWKATIKYNNKTIHLGNFIDERQAAAAYDRAALELFADFARINGVAA